MAKNKKIQQSPPKYLNAIVLLAVAAMVVAAIAPWNAWSPGDPNFRGLNLFSYFTVQSNLIAVAVYLIAAVAILRRQALGDWFRYLRGGAVLYMLVTGLVYALLLQNNPEANPSLAFDWKNFVLHQFGPLFILAWWLLWPSSKPIDAKHAMHWLVFPVLWLVYTLIRASVVHWYPYPFLDPQKAGGALGVSLYVLGIAAGLVAAAQLLAWISRRRTENASLY